MFLPPEMLRYGKLAAAQPKSILTPISEYGETFVITGGDDSFAIILSGPHAGHYIKTSDGDHFEGVLTTGIGIEVDTDTAFVPTVVQRPTLSFIQSSDGSGIVGANHVGGTIRPPILPWDGGTVPDQASAVGFTSWNAFVMVGDKKIVIHEHRGEPVSA